MNPLAILTRLTRRTAPEWPPPGWDQWTPQQQQQWIDNNTP